MASTSTSAIVSVTSPRRTKDQALTAHLNMLEEGANAIFSFAVILTQKGGTVAITLDDEAWNKAGVAQALAAPGSHTITLTRSDLSKVRKDWAKMLKSGTKEIIRASRKRDPSIRAISGFNNPREFTAEMLGFVKGAPSLLELTRTMQNLQNNISTQGIITALMTAYAYDKTSANRASLVYFSARNIGAIKRALSGRSITGDFTDGETRALQAFNQGIGPEGIANFEVESALAKVGISGDTKIKVIGPDGNVVQTANNKDLEERVINGQFIGADQFMKDKLQGTLATFVQGAAQKYNLAKAWYQAWQSNQSLPALDKKMQKVMSDFAEAYGNRPISQIDPVLKQKFQRALNDIRFADLQTITSITFVPLTPVDKYKMTAEDKVAYSARIVPAEQNFRNVYKPAKKVIDNPKKDRNTAVGAYQSVDQAKVDYGTLLGQMGNVSDKAKLRVSLDQELQNVKMYRLSKSLAANHPAPQQLIQQTPQQLIQQTP